MNTPSLSSQTCEIRYCFPFRTDKDTEIQQIQTFAQGLNCEWVGELRSNSDPSDSKSPASLRSEAIAIVQIRDNESQSRGTKANTVKKTVDRRCVPK